jgi:hypothetical protein
MPMASMINAAVTDSFLCTRPGDGNWSQCSGTADQHKTECRIRHHGGLARHDRDEHVSAKNVAE